MRHIRRDVTVNPSFQDGLMVFDITVKRTDTNEEVATIRLSERGLFSDREVAIDAGMAEFIGRQLATFLHDNLDAGLAREFPR
jgi:hypothetical protein